MSTPKWERLGLDITEHGTRIASVGPREMSFATGETKLTAGGERNMALLLAAPDLLAACEAAVEFFLPESGLPEYARKHFLAVIENDPVLKSLRAAIAKARGEATP